MELFAWDFFNTCLTVQYNIMVDEIKNQSRSSSVRTMKSDIDEVTKKDNSSFFGAVAQGAEARHERRYLRSEEKSYAKLIGILILIFVVLPIIAGGIYYAVSRMSLKNPEEKEISVPRALLQSEKTDIIKVKHGDRTGLISEIKSRQQKYASSDQYIYIPVAFTDFTTDPKGVLPDVFLNALRTTAPADFTAALTDRWNIYVRSGALIFIFETKDSLQTWGGLLHWEQSLVKDLSPFLLEGSNLTDFTFEDGLIKNNDLRIAHLSDTKDSVISYSIVLGKFVIISTSEVGIHATIEHLVADPSIH